METLMYLNSPEFTDRMEKNGGVLYFVYCQDTAFRLRKLPDGRWELEVRYRNSPWDWFKRGDSNYIAGSPEEIIEMCERAEWPLMRGWLPRFTAQVPSHFVER